MNKNEIKAGIQTLIDKYEKAKQAGRIKSYTEEDTKKGFIQPLFRLLEWDISDRNEVTSEENISGKRVDYGFYLNGRPRFYLEAKKFYVNINDPDFANQAVRYAWNKGATWAVLTNFEDLKIFNAEDIKRSLADKLFKTIHYTEYLSRLDELLLLSKSAIESDLLNKEAARVGKIYQRVPVSDTLYKDLDECRDILTKSFIACNPQLKKDPDLLDEGVQKLLDRLIFLRVAEDRGVEPNILKVLVREAEMNRKGNASLYQAMAQKFRELDLSYNSNLFSKHPFEQWDEFGGITEKVIEKLYGKKGYYEYDFKVMPADVLGTVYEHYLAHRLSKSRKGITLDKDAKKRKEQGIYYTPAFVVDYIVRHALQPVLDKCKSIDQLLKVKVLDPACGSGSFLIKALELFDEKYKKLMGRQNNDEATRFTILTQNLYGVDLDEKAVEIARLNLCINSLDRKRKLPLLTDNIKCGNSLISGTDEELKKYFGKDFRDKKPFNWQEEFPEVFKQGGFDVVIGNPPYLKELDNKELFREIRKSDFGKYYQGKMDFWYFFLHRSIEILKNDGIMAFITNSYFLKSAGAKKLIDHLQDEMVLIRVVDFQDINVFEDVSGRHLIHIWKKTKDKNNATTKYIKVDKNSFNEIIDDTKYIELPYSEVIKNSSINFETNFETNKNTSLLGDLYDVSVGVQESTDKVSKKFLEENKIENFKSGDGVFVLSGQELQKLTLDQKEKSIIKKYLNLNDVQKYYIDFNDEHLIYSDKEAKSKIAGGEYQHIKSHLDKMRRFITSSNAPYGLHRPRDNKYFEEPKLICKGMFLSPEFCFDDKKYYVGFSFSVIIQKDKDYDLKYLLGLLNSNFGKNWFNTNGKKRGIGVDIGVAVFRNFPVYKASEEQQNQIITFVDKILSLNEILHKLPENSEKWNSIKSEIEKTDHKIDEEVYKLYGLTSEEITIIESKKQE